MNSFYVFLNYSFAFLLGYSLAFSELLSRYRTFKLIMNSKNAWVYLLINGSASILTYYFIKQHNLTFGGIATSEIGKVLTAGLSAMFILRSSFFSYYDKDSDKTISVGLAAILQIFLDAAERSFDQEQSVYRLKEIEVVMKNIDFNKAEKDLTVICLNLMQNVSNDEQKRLAESIKNLSLPDAVTFDITKSVTLGITLANITGVKLLKQAVDTLGDKIKISQEQKQLFEQLNALQN